MFQAIRQNTRSLFSRINNFARGWRCSDNILVIESDDWGSIRTSTPEASRLLAAHGYDLEHSCYSNDALETDEDLEALFDVLDKYRDRRGRPACITGNMVMANPDFDAIRKNGFQRYIYEPVRKTLDRFLERRKVAQLWQTGMKNKWFRPQFHAREHVHWRQWLDALQKGSPEALLTFDLNMCGVPLAVSKERQSFFQPVYIQYQTVEKGDEDSMLMIREGIQLFHEQFGFTSLSTIAPDCAWTDGVEQIWAENGIRYIQGGYQQYRDTAAGKSPRMHFLGEKSLHNGRYLVRNCAFESAQTDAEDYYEKCLNQVAFAFLFKRPAIVTSHRVNYIGSIDASNRNRGLVQLRRLLDQVLAKWPDVNFLSSAELGFMIENDLHRVRELENREEEVFPRVKQNFPDTSSDNRKGSQ
jgi:hypothetical protein